MAFKFSKEFKIGLFGVIALTILYLGFNYLKGEDFFKNTKNYYAVYDNIDGLGVSNSVLVKGLAVGRVSNIFFQQKTGKMIVEMDIKGDLVLGDSTVAYLRSQSLLGGKAIELRLPEKIEKPHHNGDTLKSALAMGMLESITQKTLPVTEDVGTLIRKVSSLLDSFRLTEIHIRTTVEDINKTVNVTRETLSENRESLKSSLDNIEAITRNLKESSAQLKPILSKTDAVMDSLQSADLAETIAKIHDAVEQLNTALRDLNEGRGTAGKLFKDDSLYVHLNNSAADLDKLLIDLRAHPKRYVHFSVFGKKDK